jgi:hypothetical protein
MSLHPCPTCPGSYADPLDHIRKKHPNEAYTALQLQPLGLEPCPHCGTACKGSLGVKAHSAKIHGVQGSSRTSTLPRTRSQPTQPPRATTFSPTLSPRALATPTFLALSQPAPRALGQSRWAVRTALLNQASTTRKRPARTPSPSIARPRARLRTLSDLELPSSPSTVALDPLPPRDPSLPSTPSTTSSLENSLPLLSDLLRGTTDLSLPPISPRGLGGLNTPSPPSRVATPTLRIPLDLDDPLDQGSPRDLDLEAPGEPPSTLEEAHARAVAPALEKSSIQALIAYSRVPIPEKRLHAKQAKAFAEAASRVALAFLRRPDQKTIFHLLLLPRILGLGLSKGQLGPILRAYPTTIPPLDDPSPRPPPVDLDPIDRASSLLERGYLGRASRALIDPTPLAPDSLETLETLRKKHPIGPKNPFKGKTDPRAGQSITLEAISASIASIGVEKAPGLSGWTRPLLDIAISSPDSDVLGALRLLADMIRQGTAPGQDLLCASRLVGLAKPDGGVRPIAIGDLLYKVAFKAILKTSFQPEMLLPCQLGVSSPGGVEPAIYLLEEALQGPNKASIASIASLDVSNAFNALGRRSIASSVAKYAPVFYRATKWAYNKPSILVTDSGAILASAQGVRQGDPIGPLLFSLAFRPTLEALQKDLPTSTIVAYLDDVFILSRSSPTPTLDIVDKVFKGSPLSLNKLKSYERPVETLRQQGLKALGSFIGPLDLRLAFLQGKIDTLRDALTSLTALPKQYALLLLRGSLQLLLRHLLRQLNPIGLLDLWKTADDLVEGTVLALASRPNEPTPPLDLRVDLIAIPTRDGGLGIPRHAQLALGLYEAARDASAGLLATLQPTLRPREPPDRPTLRPRDVLKAQNQENLQALLQSLPLAQQRSRLENASYLGRQWLRVLPLSKQQTLADPETTEALRTRLLAPIRPTDRPCSHCGAQPSIGHEDVCKAASRRWIQRHDQLSRALIKALATRTDLDVEREPRIDPTDPRALGDLRPDFSVTLGASKYYYDVQVVAINKDSSKDDAYATLAEAANEKRRKYSALGPFFRPLIFSAGGLLDKDSAQAYKALQKLLGPTTTAWLDSSIGLDLLRARATSATSIARDSPRRRS